MRLTRQSKMAASSRCLLLLPALTVFLHDDRVRFVAFCSQKEETLPIATSRLLLEKVTEVLDGSVLLVHGRSVV